MIKPDEEGKVPARATLDKMINNFRREASQHLSKFLELKELEKTGSLGFFETRDNRRARAKEYALYLKWKKRVFDLQQLKLPFEQRPKQP